MSRGEKEPFLSFRQSGWYFSTSEASNPISKDRFKYLGHAEWCHFPHKPFQTINRTGNGQTSTPGSATAPMSHDPAPVGIISMSPELQREAGEYLASLRIKERPNNGVRLLVKLIYFNLLSYLIIFQTFSHSLTNSHTLSCTLTHSHTLSYTLTHSHTLSHTPTHFHTLSQIQELSPN